jgi:hypothetical protein
MSSFDYLQSVRYFCDVTCGMSLEDWKFAFMMIRELEAFHSLIDDRMLESGQKQGPFSMGEY